jgi:pyruvyl transferase EpsO
MTTPGMQVLKERLAIIDSVVPAGSEIAFLGYPTYLNVGDLLIDQGSELFFRSRRYKVRARYSDKYCWQLLQQRKLPRFRETVILVLQGGGNFGDLYGMHQPTREAIVRNYPRNRIVLFPQTAFFESEENLETSASIFRQHPDLHLFARDPVSADLLQRFSKNVQLCPDMAHMLWGELPTHSGGSEPLYLMRSDKEAASWQQALDCPRPIDWKDLCSEWDLFVSKQRMKQWETFNANAPLRLLPSRWYWNRHARQLVWRAVSRFAAHRSVTTSRLHGHLLACLMGIPNTLLDNSYGKNQRYYETWTFRVAGTALGLGLTQTSFS